MFLSLRLYTGSNSLRHNYFIVDRSRQRILFEEEREGRGSLPDDSEELPEELGTRAYMLFQFCRALLTSELTELISALRRHVDLPELWVFREGDPKGSIIIFSIPLCPG